MANQHISVSLLKFLRSSTTRLATSYLIIIMLMSAGFSLVFYQTSVRELGRQLPTSKALQERGYYGGDVPRRLVNELFEDRIREGRQALLGRLILLNISTLLGGGILSYYLARRTLRPIEANIAAQARFVSDASHELRTPLTALKTTNEVALRRTSISESDARTILRQNVQEVDTLQALANNLLGLANNAPSDTPLEIVQLQTVTTKAINLVLQSALDKKITIDDQVPPLRVRGRQQRLVQILTILLDNAIKYSDSQSTITVTGSSRGKHGFLKVHDQGRGIRASDLPHVFDRFYRADQSRNKEQIPGYGIGLSLAKKLIEEDGGSIHVASTFGEGSVFTVELPTA